MPPRLPTRVLTSLPLGNNAIASSSSLPPPPPRQNSRSLHTSQRGIRHRASFGDSGDRDRLRSQHHHSRSFHTSSRTLATSKDPYGALGVGKEASASEIKKAYYQLAKKWHPDSNKTEGAKEKFHEIQNAYDILGDDGKRKAFDTYGPASTQEGFDPNFARGAAGGFGGGGFQGFGGGGASDLFESLFGGAFGAGGGAQGNPFGGGGGRPRPSRGDDLESTINLSFMEACNGASRKINISPIVDCKPCTGSGLKPGEKKTTCSTCRGTGQQTFQLQGMMMASTCQACGGAGSMIGRNARCGSCEGVGRVKERREVDVEIPAGIEDGMKVKIPNLGDMPISSSGPPGDLYVRVNVRSSPVFRRQGTNLYHDAKVPLHTALLGGRVRIPTLEGDVEVKVREGTQNGEEAVLKGRGVKSVYGLGRDRGDLVVGWRVQIPRSLSPFQKKILKAYADDVEGKDPNVFFGSPPPPPPPSSMSSTSTSPPSSTSPRQSENTNNDDAISTDPSADPEPRVTSNSQSSNEAQSKPYSSSSSNPYESPTSSPPPAAQNQGFAEKLASTLGGAIGFIQNLFGSGPGPSRR